MGMITMKVGNETEVVFSDAERDAVYKCIFNRRDVRSQFLPDPVPEDVLARILRAAHHAPSVGFMQPWDFIVVRDPDVKRRVHDRSRSGPVVLGRTHQPEMDLYSAVCAVQNLWLATRAENIGLGWVSIVHPHHLRDALGIPDSIVPIAYLCVGHVTHFLRKPELETSGWLPRMPLRDVVWFDQWQARDGAESLLEHF